VKSHFDVVIVGGGLGGLINAIHLSKLGVQTALIEKNSYPKHKVCGEYISNEVLPYLNYLGFSPKQFSAKEINTLHLSSPRGASVSSKLPLGGFGLSRYTLDFELLKMAQQNGTVIIQDTVTDVSYENDQFTIETITKKNFTAKVTIGAHGKRSSLDKKLGRGFIEQKSPYVAIKQHIKFKGDFNDNIVALHNFKGGYCGVSKIENDLINLCYMVHVKVFQKYGSIKKFEEQVMCRNKHLKLILENSEFTFDKPLSISQISLVNKNLVEDHVLMCGDAAGMIHPLCGNGMGIAISTANILSPMVYRYTEGYLSRKELENDYTERWNQEFGDRIKMGRRLAPLFGTDALAEFAIAGLKMMPALLTKIISRTHGKPICISN